jgi:hypothetical protein
VTDRSKALREILAAAPTQLAQAAAGWLNEDGTEEIVFRPGEVEVADAIKLWRIRSLHVRRAGKELIGAEEFLAELAALNPAKKLTQYSFHGSKHTGSVFFEKANRRYVGLVMVEVRDTQRPSQEQTFAVSQHA